MVWLAISWVIALQGWRRLARHFRAHHAPVPAKSETLWFESATFRNVGEAGTGAQYRGVLLVDAGPAGIGLSVLPFFRFGHPALFIPWAAIGPAQMQQELFGWSTYHTLHISLPDNSAGVEMQVVSSRLLDRIEAYQQLAGLGS